MDEELTLILKLRDEATKQLKSARAAITAAGAAIAAVGFKAGADWDKATKTIVAGTGATGKALKGLQKDYQAVAKYGDGAADAIADLNTHLQLQGEELQMVAEAALKAKVDTNLFGDVASQMGLDAQGTAQLLDQLTVASQGSGVSIDKMTQGIGRNAARWVNAGGDMGDLTALVVELSDKFGPSGLRGAMSEIFEEVDKGLMPTITSLEAQLGDTTGAVERTYEAGKNWRDTLRETKDAALAAIGPYGDVAGALGSTASGLALAGPQMLSWIKGLKLATVAQRAFNLAMKLNPIGLIVTAIALAAAGIYKFRKEILGFLSGAWNKLKSAVESAKGWLGPLGKMFGATSDEVATLSDELAGHSLTTALDETEQSAGKLDLMLAALAGQMGGATGQGISLALSMRESNAALEDGVEGFSTAQMAAAVLSGVLGDLAQEFEGTAKAALEAASFIAQGFAQGGPIGLAIAAIIVGIKALGSAINNMVNGAQMRFNDLTDRVVDSLDAIRSGALTAAEAWDKATNWVGNEEGYERLRETKQLWKDAGLNAKEATRWVVNFDKANRAQDATAMRLLLKEYENVAREARRLNEIVDAAVSAYERAKDAGVKAYDTVYQAAIEAGKGQAEAAQLAADAQTAATAEVLHAEGEKYALLAAFEAALAARRSGNAKGAAEAARTAARETREAWATAMGVVSEASNDASNAMTDDARRAGNSWSSAASAASRAADHSRRAREQIPRDIYGGIPGLQHGGPVSAGRPYVVGEGGKEEIFVPSTSGSVVPNKSIPTAEEIGAAVAAALHRAPLHVSQECGHGRDA